MQARVFLCLSKKARDKFQPLHPLKKFCSEEGQDGKFGKEVRRGSVRPWMSFGVSPGRATIGDSHQPPPGRPGTAGEPRRGAVEGTGQKLLPHTSGILCAWQQHEWRKEERTPAFALSTIQLWQPLHPFLWGTEISCLCLGIMPWFVSILV